MTSTSLYSPRRRLPLLLLLCFVCFDSIISIRRPDAGIFCADRNDVDGVVCACLYATDKYIPISHGGERPSIHFFQTCLKRAFTIILDEISTCCGIHSFQMDLEFVFVVDRPPVHPFDSIHRE